MAKEELTPMQRNFNFQKVITVVGAILMLAKFLAYFMTNSVAILTDALESIVNVLAGIIGLFALYTSMRPADRSHPYGHGKVELISSSIEGTMICAAGVMIILESAERILRNDYTLCSLDIGILIVAAAAAVNFAMGYTAIRMGKSSRSMALEASGRHLCSDTYSSIGILLGLGIIYILDFAGYEAFWIDPLMALVFGAIIIYTGAKVVYRSFHGIMDAEDTEAIRQVTRCINHIRTPDVIDVHHVRVILYGASSHIDAHMVVPGSLSVEEADRIVRHFREHTMEMIGGNIDITFMAEPCRGQFCAYCRKEDCGNRNAEFVEDKRFCTDAVTNADPCPEDHDDE